jgi:dTDP-4-dehydrorhamnose reductase
MFYELREYHCQPGQRAAWVKMMEEEIIPYQISKGMVVVGSWVGEQDEDTYIWIRRFASEEERVQLYKAVYENDFWQKEMSPRIGELLDRSKTRVTRLVATPKSVL